MSACHLGNIYRIRALADSCAQRSLLHRVVAGQMSLPVVERLKLTIDGINSQGEAQDYDMVELNILTDDGLINIDVVVVDELPSGLYIPGLTQATNVLLQYNVYLANPTPYGDHVTDIGLILGANHLSKFLKGHKMVYGISLQESNVGHLIFGELPFMTEREEETTQVTSVSIFRVGVGTATFESSQGISERQYPKLEMEESPINCVPGEESTPQQDLDKLWSLSHIGILPEEYSNSEKFAMSTFEKYLDFKEGRYVVSLPWKENHRPLPDNYCMAKTRLYSIIKKLQNTPEILEVYDGILKDQLKRGYIEEVNPRTPLHPDAKLHYLPHHGVRKDSNTTALRVVYDCSSNKPSLNDCLHSGPSYVEDLGEVLLRLRVKPYVTSSDVMKAFLGIGLVDKDRDSTRFLWLKDPSDPQSPLVTYRFRSVLFGATDSPFLLGACLKHHIEKSDTPYKSQLMSQIYVDNVFGTFDTEEELVDFFESTSVLFEEAGLKLREWASNSIIASALYAERELGIAEPSLKVLGMLWCTTEDSITYSPKKLDLHADTKRKILKSLASIFDPMGVLSPIIIRGKVLLQRLWKDKYGWDQTISTELRDDWQSIVTHLLRGMELTLPRRLVFSESVELHAFSDASSIAYGSVIYIVSTDDSNKKSRLIIAKTRVAPMKDLTIPKLELMGLVLSVRLIKYVCRAYKDVLQFNNIYGWSDSQVCLHWVFSEKQLPVFVQNRVDEIRTNPDIIWKHIPGKENPCDMVSRGTNHKYVSSPLWREGPKWLPFPSEWPEWDREGREDNEDCGEKSSVLTVSTVIITALKPVFDLTQFSSFRKIKRITMLVMRFVNNLKNKRDGTLLLTSRGIGERFSHQFSNKEEDEAMRYWIGAVQWEVFGSEYGALLREKPPTVIMKQYNVLLCDQLLRCDRRLKNAELSPETKFPLLLPAKHRLVHLLVLEEHMHHHHLGVSGLIRVLREKYFFRRMRQTIRKIIRPCILCKRLQGVHFTPSPLAALPHTRVCESRPFSVTGVDLTGYFNVRINKTEVGKSYIVLFTCAVTRAVHLEQVFDNSTESFLRALRRFACRRGRTSIFYSDNATYFKAASKFISKIHTLPSIKEYLFEEKIEWRFNPARASHYGGFFERMIGLTKSCLKRILRTSLVTWEEFNTVLTEVECTLNSRPLTYVTDGFNDVSPLTPSQLLTGYDITGLPVPGELLDHDVSYGEPVLITRRYRHLLKLIDGFWRCWRKDYLLQLKQSKNVSRGSKINKGDVVLIEDEGPRLKWKLGLVTALHTSPDGNVRSVSLKTRGGETTRATTNLYPLELRSNVVGNLENKDVPPIGDDNKQDGRPIRKACTEARRRIAEQLTEIDEE